MGKWKKKITTLPTLLASFNLQAFQALKVKSNPKQTIQNINPVMEEEDLSFANPFFLQSANNPNPKQQKQPKPRLSKCNCRSSSSITQQKNQTNYYIETKLF